MQKNEDLTGIKFNRLTVIKKNGKGTQGHNAWLCLCDCGNETIVIGPDLKKNNTKSCGCARKGINSKHGFSKTRLYGIFKSMKNRCENEKAVHYKNYGGRGIKVCEEWNDFLNFKEWSLKNGYSDKLSIDRINNNGNYEPNNCRWTDMITQNNNKRTNKIVGDTGLTIREYCEKNNICYNEVVNMIRNKKSIHELIPYEMKIRG